MYQTCVECAYACLHVFGQAVHKMMLLSTKLHDAGRARGGAEMGAFNA